MLLLARRLFGGVNGDVVGATGMLTFALVLVVLALAG
jgi:cobalamin synthase